jgi:tetratricopeptide (TPR) repeat protein
MIPLLISILLQASQPAARPTFEQLAARATAARKAGRDSDALRLYQDALRLKASWTDGWWNLGSIYYEREDFAKARDAFKKLVALDKKAMPAYILLGISEYKLHDYELALEHLDTAHSMGLPPDHPLGKAAVYHLALLLNREGQYEAAAGVLLSAPENKVTSPATLIAIGLTGLRLPKLPEDLSPQEKELAGQVGRALAAPETEATDLLQKLLASHPDQPNLHYLYGMVLLHGDSVAAIAEFQKELDRDPRHVASLLAIVREKERQAQFAEALAYAQRAVVAEPGNYAAHAIMGRVLVALDKVGDGLHELELARQIEPNSPQIYFALASAYAKMGRPEDAEKARAEFLRLKNLGSTKQ